MFSDEAFLFFGASFAIVALGSFPLILVLKKLGIVRKHARDFSSIIRARLGKEGTPIMGGLIIIFAVTAITMLFNWHRATTFVPIGVLLFAAFLGGADDLLNIFYSRERTVRTLGKVARLIRVHKHFFMRVWHVLTFPWSAYKRFFYLLGSHPGSGIQAHEKILVQFIIGIIVAAWLSLKLGWTELWIPWLGSVALGWWIIPLIIFFVMFMANAVNITDGIDGLSAGTLVFAYGAYFIIALQHGSAEMAFLIATIIGALMGYLLFNIKPAFYQMGDVASLGLGVVLAAIAFALNRAMLLPIIGGLFMIEILSVILQVVWRVLLGRRLFAMAPLHHHLESSGWGETRIVMYAWAFSALFAIMGVWMSFH